MNLSNPNYNILNVNYMEFYSFFQKHFYYNPPVGLHEYLSPSEMNFYILAIKNGIILHNSGYGDPSNSIGGVPFHLVNVQITPVTEVFASGVWKYYYHRQKHTWGRTVIQCIDPIYHKDIADWN